MNDGDGDNDRYDQLIAETYLEQTEAKRVSFRPIHQLAEGTY